MCAWTLLSIHSVSKRDMTSYYCPAEDNKVCITDLNSTNGTVVDGKELGPMDNIEVEVGSEVIFGEGLLL